MSYPNMLVEPFQNLHVAESEGLYCIYRKDGPARRTRRRVSKLVQGVELVLGVCLFQVGVDGVGINTIGNEELALPLLYLVQRAHRSLGHLRHLVLRVHYRARGWYRGGSYKRMGTGMDILVRMVLLVRRRRLELLHRLHSEY